MGLWVELLRLSAAPRVFFTGVNQNRAGRREARAESSLVDDMTPQVCGTRRAPPTRPVDERLLTLPRRIRSSSLFPARGDRSDAPSPVPLGAPASARDFAEDYSAPTTAARAAVAVAAEHCVRIDRSEEHTSEL